MPNDTFTKPPSPTIKASPVDQIPEVKGEVQNDKVVLPPKATLRRRTAAVEFASTRDVVLHKSGKHVSTDTQATAQNNNGATPQPPQIIEANGISDESGNPTNDDGTPEIPTEEKELKEITTQYRLTPKFNRWCELFFNKDNKVTYMNKTQSAISAYNLDPKTQYFAGSKIGQQNYEKLSNVALGIAEERGYTADKWLDKAWLQMLKKDSPEWWDRIGEVLRFRIPAPTVINNTQNNTLVNVSVEQQRTFNDDFKAFIKSR